MLVTATGAYVFRGIECFHSLSDSRQGSRFVLGGRVLPSFEGIYRELTETFLLLQHWHVRCSAMFRVCSINACLTGDSELEEPASGTDQSLRLAGLSGGILTQGLPSPARWDVEGFCRRTDTRRRTSFRSCFLPSPRVGHPVRDLT